MVDQDNVLNRPVDLNAPLTAIRAGYSAKAAHSIGPENLEKQVIAAYITDLMQSTF